MSEIKPVYQTLFIATEFPDGWHEVDKQVHDVRANHPDQFKTRILYPAAAYEALQKELSYSKMAADAEAKFADEYKDKFEAQKQRAYALALVINDLTRMVTYEGETKEDFIKRVKSILSVNPDLRVCELQKENAAQAKRIAELEETNGLLQTQVHCLEMVAASKNGE